MPANIDGSSFKLGYPGATMHFKTQQEAQSEADRKKPEWYWIRIYHLVNGVPTAGPYVAQSSNAKLER